jgi:hypothetical protein
MEIMLRIIKMLLISHMKGTKLLIIKYLQLETQIKQDKCTLKIKVILMEEGLLKTYN